MIREKSCRVLEVGTPLEVCITRTGATAEVRLRGEADVSGWEHLAQMRNELLKVSPPTRAVFDLSGLTFACPTSLRTLADIWDRLSGLGCRVDVRGLQTTVAYVAAVTGQTHVTEAPIEDWLTVEGLQLLARAGR